MVADPEEIKKFVKFKIMSTESPPIDAIRKHFKKFGTVTYINIDPNSPCGQVRFKTAEQAELAASTAEHLIDGRSMKVGFCGVRKGGK